MTFDHDIRELLHAELPRLDAPVPPGLVAGAVARGKKLRRRRQIRHGAELSLGLTVVAALTAAAGLLLHSAGGSSTVAPAASTGPPPGVTLPITPARVAAQLAPLLRPSGRVTDITGGKSPSGLVFVNAVLDDGHGLAAVGVSITPPRSAGSPPGPPSHFADNWACMPDQNSHCVIRTLNDGSLLMTDYGPTSHTRTGQWFARHGRLDGSVVYIEEWNSVKAKTPNASRQFPPLTIDQLTALATSSRW